MIQQWWCGVWSVWEEWYNAIQEDIKGFGRIRRCMTCVWRISSLDLTVTHIILWLTKGSYPKNNLPMHVVAYLCMSICVRLPSAFMYCQILGNIWKKNFKQYMVKNGLPADTKLMVSWELNFWRHYMTPIVVFGYACGMKDLAVTWN